MIVEPIVYIVDDDEDVRKALHMQLESVGLKVENFSGCSDFLKTLPANASGCLILDVRMPDMTGPQLQAEMLRKNIDLPIIFLTGYGDIPLAVKTVRLGAVDFLTKPVDEQLLLKSIQTALAINVENQRIQSKLGDIRNRLMKLSSREYDILKLVIDGLSNKEIAAQLMISARTVEHHRSHILQKTQTDNFFQLTRLINDR